MFSTQNTTNPGERELYVFNVLVLSRGSSSGSFSLCRRSFGFSVYILLTTIILQPFTELTVLALIA